MTRDVRSFHINSKASASPQRVCVHTNDVENGEESPTEAYQVIIEIDPVGEGYVLHHDVRVYAWVCDLAF